MQFIDILFFLQVYVQCLSASGTYRTPLISNNYVYNVSLTAASLFQNGRWPNCTQTVLCGQPPNAPVNGSIQWLNGANTFQEWGYFI
jgi:hypothetical protein